MSVAAAPPRFGGGGVKCTTCKETVYPQEKIEYDGQAFHNNCFKCLDCKRVINISSVAMIKGQLYCKVCFKRTFLLAGKYSSFDDKNADRTRAESGAVEPAGAEGDAAAAAAPAAAPRGSISVSRMSISGGSPPAVSSSPPVPMSENLTELFEAIEKKNVDRVKEILARVEKEGGDAPAADAAKNAQTVTEILFKRNAKNVTPIEQAFTGIQNSRACGEAMLSWLQARIAAPQ